MCWIQGYHDTRMSAVNTDTSEISLFLVPILIPKENKYTTEHTPFLK